LTRIINFKRNVYVSWLNALNGRHYHNGPGGVITTEKPRLSWVIVGAQTGPAAEAHRPQKEWIELLVKQARAFNTPLFMKNNLKPYWNGDLIQEWHA
jgi:hypothetical protein